MTFAKEINMKIIAHLSIISDKHGNSHVYADTSKTYECGLVPIKGMDFEDVAWSEPKEIVHVTLNPDEEYYFIYLGEERYADNDACVKRLATYKSHGWS